MKKKLILLTVLLSALSAFSATYVNVDFESDIVGTNPVCSFSTPGMTNNATSTSHVWVVASSPIGSGKALEFVDNDGSRNVKTEWDLLPVTNGMVSSARFDFKFTPLRTNGVSGSCIYAAMGITNGNLGRSVDRFFSLQLYDNGTVRARAGTASGGDSLNPILNVVSGTVYKVSLFANDTTDQITYTDPKGNSTTNVLGPDSVAFWIDGGAYINYLFCTNNMASALSGTTNGLSRVGFASTISAIDLYYAIDDVRVTDVNYVSIPEYLLTVNSGTGSGSYTNGAVVLIMAATSDTNKTFVVWIGDTQYVGDPSSASTTVTMPTNAVTVTATYDKGLLTVNNGTAAGNGTYLTNGAVETITANAAPANQTFARWVGDVANVANVYSQTTTVTIAGLDIALTASYAGFFHDYEDEATLGVAPTNGNPLMITPDASTYVIVVGGITNTAATGQAVELKDNSMLGMGFEYNITPVGVSGISAARASFAFSWKDLGGTAGYSLAASFGEYASGRSMSASAARWTEARLNDNGTVTVSADWVVPTIDSPIQLIANAANTLNVFANDYNSQSVDYTVNGSTYTLPPNSVAYWANGKLLTFSGAQYVSMDLAEVPTGGGTIGTTENNLGKFGFSSSSTTLGIDYIIDNFKANTLSGTPEALYSLVVNNGGSGGLYTNGQQVVITAQTNAGKTFVMWRGDTAYLADSNSATTTVTMPAAGVTLTAGYSENVLTVNNGTGSGTYTNGRQVAISANPTIPELTFDRWTGATQYVADVRSSSTTVTMPAQDITVTATYRNLTDPPPVYGLTVINGTVVSYNNGTAVIAANVPAAGKIFDRWTGDVAYVANVYAATTTVVMPPQDITLTATYTNVLYTLTVNHGSGDGAYTNGQQVAIEADTLVYILIWPPVPQMTFDAWTGDIQYVANIHSSTTTVTMPASNITVTATYVTNYPPRWNDDSDGDGLKDWEEYIAGTDPTNAASCFKAAQTTRNVVTWTPVTGRIYSVYWSTNLVKGFQALETNILYPESSYTNATPDTRVNHYQIKVRMQ